MSGAQDTALDTSDWQVPGYEVAVPGPRKAAYALVIPVINEGERIRGQLARIAEAAPAVDVIVADGGSNDGSLDPDFITSVNVRAVLTKTGPGKLSAQLRMAYAWCLEQGYDGIVTMDGNGKDGVDAIAAMVAKLDEGCDYVQGSRYLPGGVAENTPLERTIANRFVHAPILSAAGRHWFTDTTNGFRAYSSRYLMHPEVRPFRDCFDVYGLLFYLTVRAGQLGLKVGHVPVTRRYPQSGKVPTKIEGLAPKLALLGETVFAATGGYTPAGGEARLGGLLWPLMWLLAVLIPLLVGVWASPPYSPDSWALFELSKTVFGDFYRFEHFRSYSSLSEYSSAFPPLYPALIATVDGLFGTGPRTGLLLAFASFAGFAIVSECIGRRALGSAWVGLGAALAVLLGPAMLLTEMEAGRTIPLQMLIYALVLFALLKGREITLGGAIGIGALAGLAVLNRFDAILLPILAAGGVAWFTRNLRTTLACLAAALVLISPWIAYSLTTFGNLFATDNAGIATSLDPAAFVTDWWPQDQPNWRDDPAAWVSKLANNLGAFLSVGVSLTLTLMGGVTVIALTALLGVQHLEGRRPHAPSRGLALPKALVPVLAFAITCAGLLVPQIVTGYLEYRYFTGIFWAIIVLAVGWMVLRGETPHQRQVYGKIAFAVIAPFVIGFAALHTAQSVAAGGFDGGAGSRFDAPPDVALLADCVADQPDARILVIGDDNLAARAGALAGLHTMMEPRNMAEGRLEKQGIDQFAQRFAVQYVLIADTLRRDEVSQRFELAPVPECPLLMFEIVR